MTDIFRRETEKEEDNEEEDIHIIYKKNNNNNNGTNAGEVKRSDLRHFLEQSRNHGLLRPRRLERDLEENRRRMVRRDRVRDRTDRGDRDVSYIVFSHLSFVFRSSFVVVSEKDGVLVSLSLVLFLNAEQMRRRGTQRRERERRKNPRAIII